MTLQNMLKPSAILAIALLAGPVFAAGTETEENAVVRWEADKTVIFDASEVNLDDFKWIARPVVVFADSEAVPAFQTQMELLSERPDELALRDVVLIVDTSPDERSDIRKKLRPRGFMLTLIGKDGGVKLRKPFPWDVRELSRQIDKMPIRQQEIRDRLEAGE